MTIDELIRKLRDHKKDGLPGNTLVVGDDFDALSYAAKNKQVASVVSTKVVTVRMNENGVAGKVVDGRGKPKGTQRAVRLL